jgi:enoyl-CoA hydratase/carnithine racemase
MAGGAEQPAGTPPATPPTPASGALGASGEQPVGGWIRRERDGGVLTLTFAQPRRRNPLDYPTVAALVAALREAEADPGVGAVVITGEGSAFSAGGDIAGFRRELAGGAHAHWVSGEGWAELCTLLPRLGVPVVAAVNGHALAGGCGLVALCDLALAAETATFGLTEVRFGLFPIVVLPAVRRMIGERATRELALTGRTIDATEAARIGLVNRVVPADALAKEASALASSLAANPRAVVALGKRLLAETGELPYERAVEHARAMRGVFLATGELAEGVDAFLEKRRPRW